MFSFQKIFVLAVVLAAVWYGFKLVNRLDRARRQNLKDGAGKGPAAGQGKSKQSDGVVDLVQNPDGTYGTSADKDRRA